MKLFGKYDDNCTASNSEFCIVDTSQMDHLHLILILLQLAAHLGDDDGEEKQFLTFISLSDNNRLCHCAGSSVYLGFECQYYY